METFKSFLVDNIWGIISIITPIIIAIIPAVSKFSKKSKEKRIEKAKAKHRKYVKDFYRGLNSNNFQDWRDYILKQIYGEDKFTKVFNVEIPAFSLNFTKPFDYKDFPKIYDKGELFSDDDEDSDRNVKVQKIEELDIMKKGSRNEIKMKQKYLNDYRQILKYSVRHPHLIGFMLDKYDFEESGKISKIHSKIGNYELNLYTSHILEYELYRAYQQVKDKKEYNIWDYLPFRKYIHFGTETVNNDKTVLEEALITGDRRYSLFSVQCFVMFKDDTDNYSVLLMRRSEDPNKVSAKLGFYQFMPAGGFEMFEQDETYDKDCIKRNYSLRKAIWREYLEEVFNKEEFECVKDDENNISYYTILNDPEIKTLIKLIDEGKAQFNLLGVAVDLVTMRHEISFLLKIDTKDYFSDRIRPNNEFTRHNGTPSRNNIPNGLKFLRGNKHINQGSAILFYLTKEYFSKLETPEGKKLYEQFCACESD
jgi:hypothetical protein